VNSQEAQAHLDHIKETLRSGRLMIESLMTERDRLKAELEAAEHAKLAVPCDACACPQIHTHDCPNLAVEARRDTNTVRLTVIVSGCQETGWRVEIQAQTNPSEPPDIDDSSYFPDIHNAIHHAWSVLNRLQYQFKGPHAKENL
jgi:hypothetical protein